MPQIVKTQWTGGMNSQLDPSKLDFGSSYLLGINIRTRRNTAQSVRAPLDITEGLPAGKIQGIYTFGESLLTFVAGAAFVKLTGTGPWTQLNNFQMSVTADEIDVEAVPASTVNFVRTSYGTGNTQTTNAIKLGDPINASPQCLIVMDGETQPRVIFPDGSARVAQTYAEWTSANAEYVPIARYPVYSGGILYCVGKDLTGAYTQGYRSVTGRPLDFIILLTETGNKISTSEAEGGAPALAFRASYSPVTSLAKSPASAGALLLSTPLASFLVQPNFNSTIAAEPTFNYTFLFDVGAVSKTSVVEVLGDTTIICKSGVRSFNAVEHFRWQGKNAPFSAPVNNFISSNEQTVTAGISYDDYAFYALSTVFGPGILVYDFLQEAFVAIDIYDNIGLIKQFAKVQTGVIERLYFYTEDNRIYQAFAGGVQKSKVFLADIVSDKPNSYIRPTDVQCVFSNVKEGGYAEGLLFSDRKRYNTGAQALIATVGNTSTPAELPYNTAQTDNTQQLSFNNITKTAQGWRNSAGVIWEADCELLDVGMEVDISETRAGKPTPLTAPIDNVILNFIGNIGEAHTIGVSYPVVTAMRKQRGNYIISCGNNGDYPIEWTQFHDTGRYFAVPGPDELAVSGGMPFYQWIRQGPMQYSVFANGVVVNVYMLNSRYTDMAAQLEWLELTLRDTVAGYNIVCMYDTIASSNTDVTPILTTTPFKSWGVDMIVTGCGEMYERLTMDDGLVVINVGTGGQVLTTATITPVAESRCIIQNTVGYLELVSTPVTAQLSFINATTGLTQDTYGLL